MPTPNYGKMFSHLRAYYPKPADLDQLATIMSGKAKFPGVPTSVLVPAVGNPDDELSKIPVGYTYFAQLISHDISFDESSDRHRRKDFPWKIIKPSELKSLKNLRNPFFDLESIYGHIHPTNSGEPERSELLMKKIQRPLSNKYSLPLLKLGKTKGTEPNSAAYQSYPNDLLRKNVCVDAKIVDSRNDENLLLAQTQILFAKFHNALVVELDKSGTSTYEELFEKARKLAIRYYQTIVLTDFLPRIIHQSVLDEVKEKAGKNELFYQPKPDEIFMPLEFSVAAFRFAHSIIRNNYNLNKRNPKASLSELMRFTGRGEMGFIPKITTHFTLPSVWIINWNLFYEIDGSTPQFAETLNTEISLGLLGLMPKPLHNAGGRASSLAALDLYRGRRFGLPTGQDVADAIEAEKLRPEDIKELIMKKIIRDVSPDEAQEIKKRLCRIFSRKTPLWFYILAEAEIQNDGKLGAVGGQIIAETFIHLLNHSEYSILKNKWEGDDGFLLKSDQTFGMPEMLKFIQETCYENHQKLYPKSDYPNVTNKFDELDPLEKGYQNTD